MKFKIDNILYYNLVLIGYWIINSNMDMVENIAIITHDDINEADAEQFLQTDTTTWLSRLDIYPQTLTDFEYFIKLIDLMGIFNEFKYSDLILYECQRLDAIYLLLRFINKSAVDFTEYVIRNYIIENFNNMFCQMTGMDMENEKLTKILRQYFIDIGEFIVTLLNVYDNIIPYELLISDNINKSDEKLVAKISKKLQKLCKMLINCEYYQQRFIKLGLTLEDSIIITNANIFDKIANNILDHLFTKYQPFVSNIYRFYLQIVDQEVDASIILSLIEKFVEADKLIAMESDIINYYYSVVIEHNSDTISHDTIIGISQYENFLYPNEKISINFNNCNYSIANTNNVIEEVRQRAKKYNYSVHPDSNTDILKIFVLHKMVDSSSDLVKMIAHMMKEYRNLPGIFNMYDETDLETAFMMINISNDINESYDEFLSYLINKSSLPFTYAIEFVLRMVARILSVDILFYQENMDVIDINNTVEKKYSEPIIIYQAGFMDFYLFYHDYHAEFRPLNIKKNIECKYEIVEV